MVKLTFTLTPDASARLHDALSCLGKFGDSVSFEARKDQLVLSTLNSSKSAYASFKLELGFFSAFDFASDVGQDGRFTCSIMVKALLSVFKSRAAEARGKNAGIEKCEVAVQETPEEAECRFIVKMICEHGVTKTYKLTYEPVAVVHALFDRNLATNRWVIQSSFLKEFADYFSPKAEQLDIYAEDGKATFISFTEKVMKSKSVLKHPLKTAVSVNLSDFDHFSAQEQLHIVISVKDFRSAVMHADTMNASVSAFYSSPGRPLQLAYEKDSLQCQMTLMTAGDYIGPTESDVPSAASTRPQTRGQSFSASDSRSERQNDMPPPRPSNQAIRKGLRGLGRNESSGQAASTRRVSQESDSLFVPLEESDRRWDPPDYEKVETLGWDATADNENEPHPTFRDSRIPSATDLNSNEMLEGLPPTQRISQIKGIW
ncbi:DNA repair protein Rad9 [Trichodelitschia bisporula]|uniref:DNA repair protein rad9 n=1 Tax=Trichodelitschia bisporula TaxID=703511 RepID=A0A6G1HRX7_9PEZI|nr:DNA repair protein Rad9 [Trichodelitschia bisporula]